ncbi:MAG TPA: hypothetical protein VIV60_00295, partial [Polyangiaceae bacterium]
MGVVRAGEHSSVEAVLVMQAVVQVAAPVLLVRGVVLLTMAANLRDMAELTARALLEQVALGAVQVPAQAPPPVQVPAQAPPAQVPAQDPQAPPERRVIRTTLARTSHLAAGDL